MGTNWLIEHIKDNKEYAASQLKYCNSWQYIANRIEFGGGMLLLSYRELIDVNIREIVEFLDGNGFVVSTQDDACGDPYFLIVADELCKEELRWTL